VPCLQTEVKKLFGNGTSQGNMNQVTSWSINGSSGQEILGNSHIPSGEPRGVVFIAHGFKGYKDYGMFPILASFLADKGYIAHRFNFSHSGVTNSYETFEKPELFEADTYNKQVNDLRILIAAMEDEIILGHNLPYFLFGHSRGGVTVLLTAGRMSSDSTLKQPGAVISAAAPSGCAKFTKGDSQRLLSEGFLESPSARTGQPLRIGRDFLTEQLEDPENHDLLKQVRNIRCPIMILHGSDDITALPDAALRIFDASGPNARLEIIENADHGFNTTNPMPENKPFSPEFKKMLDTIEAFLEELNIQTTTSS